MFLFTNFFLINLSTYTAHDKEQNWTTIYKSLILN